MAKIKGEDLMVLTYKDNRWVARAYAIGCELDVTIEIIRAGSPTSGKFPKKKTRMVDWKISCENLLSDLGDDFYEEAVNGTPIMVMLTTVEPHPEPQTGSPLYQPSCKYQRQGEAVISRYTVTGRHRTHARASITLEGSGELVKK